MITGSDSNALARRALAHLRNKSTDQATSTLQVPIEAYTDALRFAREVDQVFHHLPLGVALCIELPKPGSYQALKVTGKPIILARGEARSLIHL